MDYSIWIIPSEPLYIELSSCIFDLSHKYSSPRFNPHMTILTVHNKDLTVVKEAVLKAISGISNMPLTLGSISFSTTYYQSVFVRVNSTAPLMQLNLDIKRLLNEENSVYMPHISLMYGDHDMVLREKIASHIKLQNAHFIVNEVVIVPLDTEPIKWKPIATFSIGNRN